MVKQIGMPPSVKRHLEEQMIGQEINGFQVAEFKGAGNTAVTFKVKDSIGFSWALKLVTRDSYGDRAPFREIARFTDEADERFLVFPKEVGEWSLKLRGKVYEFIWFKSRFVDGDILQKFINSNNQFSISEEIKRYIEHLTVALEELSRLGFSHGDLHDRNIMREVVGKSGSMPEIRYVVIDFSEAFPLESTGEGLSKDIENFGQHLRSFSDAAYKREIVTRDDQRVLNAIGHIPGLLEGMAPETLAIYRASQILDMFHEGLRTMAVFPRELDNPFKPLSSDNIANEALLADLCVTNMWWAEELKKNCNILLIGPRGCGKTMIFKRMRLKTKISADKKSEIADDPYVGFYLPCESVFYMRFSDFSQIDIDKNKYALVLFFNMAVATEVTSTLSVMPPPLGPVTQNAITTISKLILEEAESVWEQSRLPSSVTTFNELSSCAEAVMRFIRRSIAYAIPITARGSIDFVTRLMDVIKKAIPSLSNRYFIFFLDDYTEERVPLVLQEELHPIVCQRSQHICFKISAHMFGSIYDNPRPLALDEGRNIEKIINLGSAYLNRKVHKAEGKALLRILDERIKHSKGYQGTINEWLGQTTYPGGKSLSQALHDKGTRKSVHYHGVKCLMDLCTGDYSEMIRMVGEIFNDAGVKPNTSPYVIPPAMQNRVIERVSREYLSRIRHIRPDGQKLYEIVLAFGKLSKVLLYNHPLVGQGINRNGKVRKDPYDLLNIYVDDLTKAMASAKRTWERLQKASIFVDIQVAPSLRLPISDRATLRRIYCPAFGTTLTSSEHLQLTKQQFEYFIDRPEEFCNHHLKNKKMPEEQLGFLTEDIDRQDDTESETTSPLQDYTPQERDQIELVPRETTQLTNAMNTLPEIKKLHDVVKSGDKFDLYIGAMGFEDRTTSAAASLVDNGNQISNAVIFEFDTYYKANERNRERYDQFILALTCMKPYRPLNAPIAAPDPLFSERFTSLLDTISKGGPVKIIFDITSCPSLILSAALRILLDYRCDLTLLYSESEEYFPTLEEWQSGKVKPRGEKVRGPFSGVRFVTKPPILQADDTGELPIILILFPTFNRERTDGVLADLDPAARIWIFGEPHDLEKNAYRIDMAKWFAATIMNPGDPWALLTTFDYRQTMLALSALYAKYRFKNRIVIMPHGSKLQDVGTGLFATVHQVSMVFAMPKTYDTDRYSLGCKEVWALPLGNTETLISKLKTLRTFENVRPA
ncbi:hypothetical protein LLG96_11000 [bacterium]|nr:hypothetical protein [bacterium]